MKGKSSTVVAISIFPPGVTGTSLRLSLDPSLDPRVASIEIANVIQRALKKSAKKVKPNGEPPA